ncbi:MAG: queuosine precursor transporter [Bdellovibrionales bacterium]|nr:queuosine precursor transporter [Bdellovibrionales bacterium]
MTDENKTPVKVPARRYKYFDLVMAAFVTVLICSNLIAPGKVCHLIFWGEKISFFGTPITFSVGNLFFPFSYIFGDILTEVYGYARSRKVIWAGFGGSVFSAIMAYVVVAIPSTLEDGYQVQLQQAIELAFGNTFRIVIASLMAFWAGEFVNSYVLAKMKIWTKGKMLWSRTIGSTIFGQAADSMIFYPLAFWGLWTPLTMLKVILFNMVFKIVWEAAMTPFTYFFVAKLKKLEQEDYYDFDTNFSPFSLED